MGCVGTPPVHWVYCGCACGAVGAGRPATYCAGWVGKGRLRVGCGQSVAWVICAGGAGIPARGPYGPTLCTGWAVIGQAGVELAGVCMPAAKAAGGRRGTGVDGGNVGGGCIGADGMGRS
eukprot:6046666-Alexandrium_andersonii.AAC.1